MSFDMETGVKTMAAERLREVLAELPADAKVRANAVGNLLVTDAGGNYIGYIDFNEEKWTPV